MGSGFLYSRDIPVVDTKQGKVRGYMDKRISIFKGIPYAKAKRFHAPEPVEAWKGVLDATSYGFVCPLLDSTAKPNGELLVPHRYWIMNEDCQNLNIWTPACDKNKRPVIVWLHGGGYEAGSSIEQIAYEGENMCSFGQVVVVSINHRLNILGYFDLSAYGEEYANSGNAGTDDIIAALQWIRDNIAEFGGDPDNVTVMGQSGGGAKVTTLLQTPAADGLYHRGINMSGVIGSLLADQEGSGENLAEALMKEVNVTGIKELEEIPYALLAAAYLKVKPVLLSEGYYVGGKPHPNEFYVGTPDKHGFRKETAEIPLMVGTVYGEFFSFAETSYDKRGLSKKEGIDVVKHVFGEDAAEKILPLYTLAYSERNPVDILTLDYIFRRPTKEYIRQRGALNDCTYAYLFNLDMPIDGGRAPWHCADIPFAFHNINLVPMAKGAKNAEKIEEQFFESVISFARSGNPNHNILPMWSPSTEEEEHTMVFDVETRERVNYDEALISAAVEYQSVMEQRMRENAGKIQH